MPDKIRENSFDPAPGGTAGALNYQAPIGTHSSPSSYQDPQKFNTKDYNKYFNPDVTGQPDTEQMDNSGSLDGDVEKIFAQSAKPSIDDVLVGVQYELQRMIRKDKRIAKERVVNNLKKFGPKYYTKLHMLNIDDKDMDSPVQETINVLNQMISEKQEKRKELQLNDAIKDILNQKREEKFAKSDCLIKLCR